MTTRRELNEAIASGALTEEVRALLVASREREVELERACKRLLAELPACDEILVGTHGSRVCGERATHAQAPSEGGHVYRCERHKERDFFEAREGKTGAEVAALLQRLGL